MDTILLAFYIVTFLFGIVIGSFLNVCIYRIPEKENIVKVRSHCMNCGHLLQWYELVPLLSYLFLGGKCRKCKAKKKDRMVRTKNDVRQLRQLRQLGFPWVTIHLKMSKLDKSVSSVSRISMQIFIEEAWQAGEKKKEGNAGLKYSERKLSFWEKDTSYRKKIQVVKRLTKKNRLAGWAPSGYKRDNIPDKKTKAISPPVLGEYRFCLHGECTRCHHV